MNRKIDDSGYASILANALPDEIKSLVGFTRWYEPIKRSIQVAVLEVHEEVDKCLQKRIAEIKAAETTPRNIWTLTSHDSRSLLKSIESIRSKIVRTLTSFESSATPIERRSLEEVETIVRAFPDLGRFRISCQFATDVDHALDVLIDKKTDGDILLGKYPLNGKIKDYVFDLQRRDPGRGHRARQFSIRVSRSGGGDALIEIQLMTLLQIAWDQRNHPMYEWTRDGRELPAELVINDVALAETLHLVDLQAARNWEEFQNVRKAADNE